jgi:hypothetical protein
MEILSWIVWILSPFDSHDLPSLEVHADGSRLKGSGDDQALMKALASGSVAMGTATHWL